ncbi:hypothetical protein CDAR_293171 [Caerostris darwini]|uniref:LAGLIDADG homing endonuclease n=1 Tax=Caerostris darwini TaxID=1538125 RepID=A0AAV4QH93_9ARAC|nr:hypothetical protein CDAR_293171 [Caerostris darwini]
MTKSNLLSFEKVQFRRSLGNYWMDDKKDSLVFYTRQHGELGKIKLYSPLLSKFLGYSFSLNCEMCARIFAKGCFLGKRGEEGDPVRPMGGELLETKRTVRGKREKSCLETENVSTDPTEDACG